MGAKANTRISLSSGTWVSVKASFWLRAGVPSGERVGVWMGEKTRVMGGHRLAVSSTRPSLRMYTFEKEAHSLEDKLNGFQARGLGRQDWMEGRDS